MSIKSRVIWGLVLVGGVAFGGVKGYQAFRNNQAPKAKAGLFAIKTPTRKDCGVTPYTLADRLGFLAEEGLVIQWTGETQPALVIPSILRGDNDVSAFHPNQLAVAKAGGAAITGVAEGGLEPVDPKIDAKYRHMWWYINPEKLPGVKTLADVAKVISDRKIKMTTGAANICTDFEGKLLADKYGIPRDRIEWINMPDVQSIQALKQGLVDVSAVHPPFYKGMGDAGALKIADSSETGLGAAAGITYWTFRDDFIKKHPDKVAAWARALHKAQVWANANPEGSRKMTEEAIGQPVTGNHWYSENTGVDGQLSALWLKDLVDTKLIAPGKVTTENIVTQDIAKINEKVYAERGSVALNN
jgi:ABC-type nitrate/sulfonate/bicarbonate transport system substrate-binding protein